MECRAVVLNINYGHNKKLMEACRKLYEYSCFVETIRDYLNTGMKLGAAMDQAIEDCIRSDILKEFLLKHRGEVKQVILTEYNQERHAKTLLEEGRKQGREENAKLLQKEREENARLLQKAQEQYAKSIRQLLLQVLELKGLATEPVVRRIQEEQDLELLQLWTSFAGDSNSAEELEKKIL